MVRHFLIVFPEISNLFSALYPRPFIPPPAFETRVYFDENPQVGPGVLSVTTDESAALFGHLSS